MKFLILLFGIPFILFQACGQNDNEFTIPPDACGYLDSLPYTLTHYNEIADASNKMYLMGGAANDSITSSVIVYNKLSNNYSVGVIPKLPQRLMNGFAFALKDSIYYGGGYTTNWNDAYTNSADTNFCIRYITSSTGFISSGNGKIYKTTNSGMNWMLTKLNTNMPLRSEDFAGTQTGWTVSDSARSKIFKTTNAGLNWSSGNLIGNIKAKSVDFVSTDTGWVAGEEGKIFKSVTGGASWDSVPRKSFDNLYSISFVNKKFGWACGENGRIVKTTNGGVTWDTVKFSNNALYSIHFKDSLKGYIAGANGTIGKSTDGGATWSGVKTEAYGNLRSVDIRNSDTVVVCGDRGNILYSNNGDKWERIYGVSPNNLLSICLIPGTNKTSVCGSNGYTSYANNGCFRYSISNNTFALAVNNTGAGWITKQNIPKPIAEVYSSAAALNDSSGYVFGGMTTGDSTSKSVYRYSNKTGKWTAASNMPSPRRGGGLAIVGDSMMVYLGGRNSYNATDTLFKITVGVNPENLTYSFGGRYPLGPVYNMATKGIRYAHIALILGGQDSSGSIINKLVIYKPIRGTFDVTNCCDAINWITVAGIDTWNYNGNIFTDYQMYGMLQVLQNIYTYNDTRINSMESNNNGQNIEDFYKHMNDCIVSIQDEINLQGWNNPDVKDSGVLDIQIIWAGGLGKGYIPTNKNRKISFSLKYKDKPARH